MRETTYKSYFVTLLMFILVFNLIDQIALGILLQSIKVDLRLSDTQLGLLTGIAFAFFYSIMGIPIARWADRGNRVTIITIATALQCAGVALCGMATSFVQLMLVRVGVAVGEAGCVPTAHSLIADHFTRAERPRALARYMMGYPIAAVLGYFLAGWLNQLVGWRLTFVIMGLPGLLLSLIAWFTLREPRIARQVGSRLQAPVDEGSTVNEPNPSLREVVTTLWRSTTFRHLVLGFSVLYFFGFGISKWKPAFFIRSYGIDTGELGTWFAVMYGIAGLVGMHWGGEVAARRAANNESLQLRAMAVAYCGFGVISAMVYLSPSPYLAFALMFVSLLGLYTTYGPLFATIQTLVPARMRALALATIYFFANLIGMGLGPLAAGALSDALRPRFGEESLRYSLLILCPGYLWTGWHLWRASRTVAHDLEATQGIDKGAAAQAAE